MSVLTVSRKLKTLGLTGKSAVRSKLLSGQLSNAGRSNRKMNQKSKSLVHHTESLFGSVGYHSKSL